MKSRDKGSVIIIVYCMCGKRKEIKALQKKRKEKEKLKEKCRETKAPGMV